MLPEESAPSAPAQQNVSKSNLNWWNKSNSATLFHQGEKRVVSRCSKDHNVFGQNRRVICIYVVPLWWAGQDAKSLCRRRRRVIIKRSIVTRSNSEALSGTDRATTRLAQQPLSRGAFLLAHFAWPNTLAHTAIVSVSANWTRNWPLDFDYSKMTKILFQSAFAEIWPH